MLKINIKKSLLIFLIVTIIIFIPMTYSKYTQKITKKVVINAIQPNYTVVFNANGGSDTMENQLFAYKTPQNLSKNTFTKDGYAFIEWNTELDGSGTSYVDEESVNNLTNVSGSIVNLYAQWNKKIAKIDNTYYDTLQDAINAVPTDKTLKTVVLLQNTSENINIKEKQNIVFDFRNNTLSNNGNNPVIVNNGTISINNGTIATDAATNGAINNNSTGTINISGGSVIVTGGR